MLISLIHNLPCGEQEEYRSGCVQEFRILLKEKASLKEIFLQNLLLNHPLTIEPDAQQREQLLWINRFSDVIRCSSLNALFSIAFHGFSGEGNHG